MSAFKELNRAYTLLSQALNAANNSLKSSSGQEVKQDIRKAMLKIEKIQKKGEKKSANQNSWWSTANVAKSNFSNVSKEAAIKTLKDLNSMIDNQQKVLNDMEKKSEEISDDEFLTEDFE